jgi:methylated-DNA-[protein]-cysteine S-methyltransferase
VDMHIGRYELAGWGEFWAGVIKGKVAYLQLLGEASQGVSGGGETPEELLQFADKWSLSPTLSRDSSLDELWSQLTQYLGGDRKEFELPLQLLGTDFQRMVWQMLMTIPWGSTVTYGELAARLGNRRLARAVGRANGLNPVPIIVPCHRVVAAGGLGGYSGGLGIKQRLLQLEGRPWTTAVRGKGG